MKVLVSPPGGNGSRLAVQPEEVVSELLAGTATAGSVGTKNASTMMAGRASLAALRRRAALDQRTMTTVTFLRQREGPSAEPKAAKAFHSYTEGAIGARFGGRGRYSVAQM
jgi:hypothetical protein